MKISEKQFKKAKETISKLNGRIKESEDQIAKINKYIKKAEDNYDYHRVSRLEEIKRRFKQNNHQLKESKKELMFMIADFTEIDKSTVNAVSDKPLARKFLQANYKVSNTFKGISLNSINDKLPVRLSNKRLSKLIHECFPNVKARKCTNDIKYNMELVK